MQEKQPLTKDHVRAMIINSLLDYHEQLVKDYGLEEIPRPRSVPIADCTESDSYREDHAH